MNYRVIITIILISLAAISCRERIAEKPFIIIKTGPRINSEKYGEYQYQDKNGTTRLFYDEKGKFKVGDTLK